MLNTRSRSHLTFTDSQGGNSYDTHSAGKEAKAQSGEVTKITHLLKKYLLIAIYCFIGTEFSVWDDDEVLQMNSGDGCTTM